MQSNLDIPPKKSGHLLTQLRGILNQDLADMGFEGAKEAFDPTILPRAMLLGGLVSYA
nr:hypothetical protein [Nitrincola iocasae]